VLVLRSGFYHLYLLEFDYIGLVMLPLYIVF